MQDVPKRTGYQSSAVQLHAATLTGMASSNATDTDSEPHSRASQQLIGANSYNAGFPWAFRCTWDRSAFPCTFPAHSYGRAMTRADVVQIGNAMIINQGAHSMPLVEVAAMGPDGSEWTAVVWRSAPVAGEIR